jgi:hypothetical protein
LPRKIGRKKRKKYPELVPLAYDRVYCELCGEWIEAGQPVAWWHVRGRRGRKRMAAYCATCHHANLRHGKPLR